MNREFSRRGLLKIVAGAVAGAIGANALVQKVEAKEPSAVVTGHEGQIKAIKLTQPGQVLTVDGPVASPTTLTNQSRVLPWPETTGLAVLPTHDHKIHFPQYDNRFTILSNSDGPNYLRDYRLDDGSDDLKSSLGWTEMRIG